MISPFALLLAQETGADIVGYFTFLNILWVFVALIFLVAVIGLLGKYVLPLLAELPVQAIEAIAYATGVSLTFITPYYLGPIVSFICAIIGLPILCGAVAYRVAEHWRVTLGLAVFLIGCAAHQHQSQFFGGVSVMVLLWLCGSWVFPFLSELTEGDVHFVPSGFWASAIILAVSGGLAFGVNPPWFLVFKPGAFWLAGLVYTGGLLTLSYRYYYKESIATPMWLLWQTVAVLSGVGAMFLGHTYASYMGTTVLQEIGGSFLSLYLIQKITEIPWNLEYWPWLALGAALACYGAVSFASKHPDYFLAF
jgi:hypothetical protein